MSRLLLAFAFAVALAACQPQVADLLLAGPTRVLTDGTSVKLTALATNERGEPGR